jgi:hypothetical protein
MVRPRIIEIDQGIQGDFNVQIYDGMMRRLRDKGWMETDPIITVNECRLYSGRNKSRTQANGIERGYSMSLVLAFATNPSLIINTSGLTKGLIHSI